MTPILFAWITSFLYGTGGIIGKLASKNDVNNPWLYNFIWSIITFLMIAPIALYFGVGLPADWTSILILGVTGAFSGVAYILALQAIDISILAPFYNLRTPIIVLFGTLFFGDRLSPMQSGLIALMVLAGIVVGFDEHFSFKSLFRPGMLKAFFAILTSACFNLAVKNASIHNSFWDVSFWSNLLSLLFTFVTWPFFSNAIRSLHIRKYTGIAYSTIFSTAGLLASFKALEGNIGISMAIITLPVSMILAIILSVVAPKLLEKHSWKVYAIRIIAATVMFGSALLLSK